MPRLLELGAVSFLALAVAGPAAAQRIEVTPFAGYQLGGELVEIGTGESRRDLEPGPTWGILVDLDLGSELDVELVYSSLASELDRGLQGAVDVDVETLQIGAIRTLTRGAPVTPYVGVTVGATRIEVAGDSDTRISGALSVGARMLVSDHLGFRLDGRVVGTSAGSGEIGCVDSVCIGYPDTTIIWQYALSAGIILHFGL